MTDQVYIWLQDNEEEGEAPCGCRLLRSWDNGSPAFIMCGHHLKATPPARRKDALTKEDWVEIYYALVDKQSRVDDGYFDENPKDTTEEWSKHLGSIIGTIGPDGENMYEDETEKIRIVVTVDGGLVQNVYAEREGVEVVVLDGDIEGADEDEITKITDNDGGDDSVEMEWVMSGHRALIDADFVSRVHKAMEE